MSLTVSAWRLWVRSTTIAFTVIGGCVAVTAIIVQVSRQQGLDEIYALALATSMSGIGFALDDAARETVAASPTSLAHRRSIRVVISSVIIAAAWLVIAVTVTTTQGWRQFPLSDIAMEVAALGAIGLAVSSVVQRRTNGFGGPTAAMVVLIGPAFLSGVVFREVRVFPSLVPGRELRERWVWLGCAAVVLLALSSRDPGASRKKRLEMLG